MPKKTPAFSKGQEQEALEYLLSLGFELKKSRAKTAEGRSKYLLRQANAAKKAEAAGLVPSQQAGRGKHQGTSAPETHVLPIQKITAKGRIRGQLRMYNQPRDITSKDIAALYKAAGSPSHVSLVVSGTTRWVSPRPGEDLTDEDYEQYDCEAATLTAHTRKSTMEAIFKRKLDIFEVANHLLRYGPNATAKRWCTIDYIALYETPRGEPKEGRRRKE